MSADVWSVILPRVFSMLNMACFLCLRSDEMAQFRPAWNVFFRELGVPRELRFQLGRCFRKFVDSGEFLDASIAPAVLSILNVIYKCGSDLATYAVIPRLNLASGLRRHLCGLHDDLRSEDRSAFLFHGLHEFSAVVQRKFPNGAIVILTT